MMVMPSTWSSPELHYWAGRYPGSVGQLMSPGGWRQPKYWLPYALDNGAWGAAKNDREWDAHLWRDHLRRAALCGHEPRWAVVPDVVGNKVETVERWKQYAPQLLRFGWPLAFAAQDGMIPDDVPAEAHTVFLGGSTEWKLGNIGRWCRAFPGRLHVARVTTYGRLRKCCNAGAVSCDGTGFGRGGTSGRNPQLDGLRQFIEEEWDAGKIHAHG